MTCHFERNPTLSFPQKRVSFYPALLPQVFHLKFDKAYITDLNSINQHIYNKLLVRCFVFHVLEKNFQRLYILEDFSFFSDEVAVLRTGKDKLENFWAKFAVIRWWVPMFTI